jgi:hypothetical protein
MSETLLVTNHEITKELEEHSRPQRLGLPDSEMTELVKLTDSVSVIDAQTHAAIPCLVPVKPIDWFNSDFINHVYERPESTYYFPPIVEGLDSEIEASIGASVVDKLLGGSVVIVDAFRDKPEERLSKLIDLLPEDMEISIENLGGGGQERYLNQYVAEVSYVGQSHEYNETISTFDAYIQMVDTGELADASIDGVSCIDVTPEDEIENLWSFYNKRFGEIAEEHPINAGYDEASFKDLLRDPSVVKIVNRADGDITTLCMFLTDLEQCPWLDVEYYQKNHSDALETNNLFVFLGIVTDDKKKGNNYATDVVDLLALVTAKRNSPVIVTFECNEISENITPILVKAAIENSGVAHVEGIDKPVSQLSYFVVKASSPN